MILHVRCKIDVCGVRITLHPCVWAIIVKSPRLNGSAMLALLGTRSSIWCNWHLLCQVQCDPIILLSGWPLRIACFDASLSHNCMYGLVRSGRKRTGAMMAVQASRKYMKALDPVNWWNKFGGTWPLVTMGLRSGAKTTIPHPLGRSLYACCRSSSVSSEHRLWTPLIW